MSGRAETTPQQAGVAVRDVARLLSSAANVTLFAHINPDADALGSALAVGTALRRAGAEVQVSFGQPAEVPASLRDLDPGGLVVPVADVPAAPPTLVVFDTGSLERLGGLADRVQASKAAGGNVIVVDHHVGNTRYGTHHLIDEHAEATALLALELLDELGAVVDKPIARCLYAGLATDTRSFRRARPSTHRVAARLLEAGVDPEATIRPLLDSHPFSWLAMLSSVFGNAELESSAAQGFGLVHTTVGLSESAGMRGEETDSVIDILRTTSEAEVAAVFKEISPGRWSVSLRADSRIDVGHAARTCGGGGHRLAAGFTAEGSSEDLLVKLREAIDSAPQLSG